MKTIILLLAAAVSIPAFAANPGDIVCSIDEGSTPREIVLAPTQLTDMNVLGRLSDGREVSLFILRDERLRLKIQTATPLSVTMAAGSADQVIYGECRNTGTVDTCDPNPTISCDRVN